MNQIKLNNKKSIEEEGEINISNVKESHLTAVH